MRPVDVSSAEAIRPAYRVETNRLLLRCWQPEDALELRPLLDLSADHLRPWIPFMKDEPRTLQQTADWLAVHRARFDLGEYFRYAVYEQASGALVGENMLLSRIGPDALEVGYWTSVNQGGRGLASEATCAMVKLAFEWHHVSRVELHCAPENLPSAAIAARLGFTHEATLRERAVEPDGRVRDLMIWSLLATEYPGSAAAQQDIRAFDNCGERLL